jgi:hypothetical protein
VPDPDTVDLIQAAVLLDVEHAANILAVWACGFTWTPEAMARALEELAPYARQSMSIHASGSLKSHKRMMRKMQEQKGNAGSGGPSAGSG